MSTEVFLLGLDTIGTSVGLALAEAELDVHCVGYDPERERTARAVDLGAVDKTVSHPRDAPRTAEMVILDVPAYDAHTYLEMLAVQLMTGGLVLDTTPARTLSLAYVQANFPEDRHYIGATPIVGPNALLEAVRPRADLFNDGLLALTVPRSTSAEALRLATNLTHVLGAVPFFVEAAEHDGILAAVEGLPHILRAALMRTFAASPARREMERMAGRAFAEMTLPDASASIEHLSRTLDLNRNNLATKVGALIEELDRLRTSLLSSDQGVIETYLEGALQAREAWLAARSSSDWAAQEHQYKGLDKGGGVLRSLIGFGPPDRDEPG
jgi:prephenate dehydrogenase